MTRIRMKTNPILVTSTTAGLHARTADGINAGGAGGSSNPTDRDVRTGNTKAICRCGMPGNQTVAPIKVILSFAISSKEIVSRTIRWAETPFRALDPRS